MAANTSETLKKVFDVKPTKENKGVETAWFKLVHYDNGSIALVPEKGSPMLMGTKIGHSWKHSYASLIRFISQGIEHLEDEAGKRSSAKAA